MTFREEYLKELEEWSKEARLKKPEDRTYEDRFKVWTYEDALKPRPKSIDDWDEGEEVFICDGEKLSNNEIKDGFGKDFPDWFREAGKHFNQKVKMDDNKEYTLVGMSYTYLDYYYTLVDSNGKKRGWSCVGGITYLE